MLLFTHTKKTLKNNGTEPIKSDTVPVSFIVRAALGPEAPNTGHTCSTISSLAWYTRIQNSCFEPRYQSEAKYALLSFMEMISFFYTILYYKNAHRKLNI